MSNPHTPHNDLCRYFAARQRAYLINMSEERDRELYESMSGTIVRCGGNSITLQVPYATGQELPDNPIQKTMYKLTSESMGSGIQIMAELAKITAGNIFHLKLHGNLEMYQRRQSPRVDATIKLFQIRRDTSLAAYRKEFKRIVDSMNTQGMRPNLKLLETPINLSAGGLRIEIDAQEPIAPLSMFFLDFDSGKPIVCVVAEMAWKRHENNSLICGYRFLQIHKADQDRIKQFVQSVLRDQGVTVPASKHHWELLDRMIYAEPDK